VQQLNLIGPAAITALGSRGTTWTEVRGRSARPSTPTAAVEGFPADQPAALLRRETTAGCECRRRESKPAPQRLPATFPGDNSGVVAETPAQPAAGNPAIPGRLDAGLDALTVAELEELLDVALDAGRLDKARGLRDRIKARGRS